MTRRINWVPTLKPNEAYAGMSGYHAFEDDAGNAYGSFEVFWSGNYPAEEGEKRPRWGNLTGLKLGWYWTAGFPGCLPDGDANGPFNSSRAAYRDARSS